MEIQRFSNGVEQGHSQQRLLAQVHKLRLEMEQLEHSLGGERARRDASSDFNIGTPICDNEVAVGNLIRSRNLRGQFFSKGLFADPAWDMILDLYVSEIIRIRVSVSSLCIASNVPASTALRWMNVLESEGLVSRSPDAHDRRRYFVSLTKMGLGAMNGYLAYMHDVCPTRATPG